MSIDPSTSKPQARPLMNQNTFSRTKVAQDAKKSSDQEALRNFGKTGAYREFSNDIAISWPVSKVKPIDIDLFSSTFPAGVQFPVQKQSPLDWIPYSKIIQKEEVQNSEDTKMILTKIFEDVKK